jgi:putative chitinase
VDEKGACVISFDQLQRVMPHAGKRAAVFLVPLNDAMQEFEITTVKRQAAFLAQIAHESGSLRYVSEIASGKAYNGRADLGNTKPEAIAVAAQHGSTPGPWWKGHGLIQITGYDNHVACGDALGLDLVNGPTLLEQPGPACRSAAWFWHSRKLNELADRGEFQRITKRINGGLNGQADRLEFYITALGVLG